MLGGQFGALREMDHNLLGYMEKQERSPPQRKEEIGSGNCEELAEIASGLLVSQ